MGLTNLPTELLLEIIWNGDFDNGDLKNLRLAHSSFRHVASTYLFRKVKLQLLKGHSSASNPNELLHPQHILDRIRGFLYDEVNEDVRDHVRHVEVFVRPETALDGRSSVDGGPPMPPLPDRFSYMEKELFGTFVKRYVTKILSPECFPRLADVSLHYNAQMVSPSDVAFFFDAMKKMSRGGKPRFHLHIRKCSAVGEELDHVVSLCSLRLADLFIYEEQTEQFAKLIARVLDDSPDLSKLSLQGYGNEILLPELFHHISKPTTMNKVQELCLDTCDVTHLDMSELERFTSLKELTVHRSFGPGWSTLLDNGTVLTKLATSEMSEELVSYLENIPESSLRHLEMRLPAFSRPQLQDDDILQEVLDRFWRSVTRFRTSLRYLALTIPRSQIRRAANNNAVGEDGLSPWCINVLSKTACSSSTSSATNDGENHHDAVDNRFTNLEYLDAAIHLDDTCIATLMDFAATSPNLKEIKTTLVGRVQTGDNGHLYSIGFKRGEEEVAKVLQQVLDYRFKEETRWRTTTTTATTTSSSHITKPAAAVATPTLLRISAALENYGAWRLEIPPHHYKIDRMMEIDAPRFVFCQDRERKKGYWQRDPLDNNKEYAAWGRMKHHCDV